MTIAVDPRPTPSRTAEAFPANRDMRDQPQSAYRFNFPAAVAICAAMAMGLSFAARADDYPLRPIHVEVATAAGGPTDLTARLIGKYIDQYSGKPMIVENRPGGGGTAALGVTAKPIPTAIL